jgi:Tol biopolymer transport system component
MRGSVGVGALTCAVAACAVALPASASFPGVNGRIVFTSNRRADLQLQVFAVAAAGGTPRNVSRRPASTNTNPGAGSNGDAVFASASLVGDQEPSIWLVSRSGTRRRVAFGRTPALSYDGSRLLFTAPDSDGLFVIPTGGGGARRIADTGYPGRWSPDGRWIAVADGNGVLLVRPDGSAQRRLAEGVTDNQTPASWSPDSRQLVVSDGTLRVIDVETGSIAALASGDHPAWAPDGERIAFTQGSAIATIRPNGSDPHMLTRPGDDGDWSPTWSPDSRQIAFVRTQPYMDATRSALGIVDLRTGDVRFVTPTTGHVVDAFSGVSWSWDGRTLYYASRSLRDVFHLFSVDANLRGVRQLTRGPGNDRQPVWAGDGRRVAFVRNGDSLVVLDRGRTRVVARATGLSSPTWSPGGRLAYDADGAIWVVDPSRRGLRRLLAGSQPAWSPTGRWLAYVHGGLRLVHPDGSGDHWLKADQDELVFNSPTWSPRGNVLYYLAVVPCRGDEVFACSDFEGVVKALKPFAAPVSEVPLPAHQGPKPAVSPDGRFLIFGGGAGLSSVPVSGSGTFFGRDSYAIEAEPDWQRLKASRSLRGGRATSR